MRAVGCESWEERGKNIHRLISLTDLCASEAFHASGIPCHDVLSLVCGNGLERRRALVKTAYVKAIGPYPTSKGQAKSKPESVSKVAIR